MYCQYSGFIPRCHLSPFLTQKSVGFFFQQKSTTDEFANYSIILPVRFNLCIFVNPADLLSGIKIADHQDVCWANW